MSKHIQVMSYLKIFSKRNTLVQLEFEFDGRFKNYNIFKFSKLLACAVVGDKSSPLQLSRYVESDFNVDVYCRKMRVPDDSTNSVFYDVIMIYVYMLLSNPLVKFNTTPVPKYSSFNFELDQHKTFSFFYQYIFKNKYF